VSFAADTYRFSFSPFLKRFPLIVSFVFPSDAFAKMTQVNDGE